MLEALERDMLRKRLSSNEDRTILLRQMEDSFSNAIQLSATQRCLAEDPVAEIEAVGFNVSMPGSTKVGGKREASGRQRILGKMRDAFEQSGSCEVAASGSGRALHEKG